MHHQAKIINDELTKNILAESLHWLVESIKLLQLTIDQLNQRFIRNEDIINKAVGQLQIQIDHERDRRIYQNLGKYIYTTISQHLSIEEKDFRDKIASSILSLNNENQIHWSLQNLEKGRYNKTILYLISQTYSKLITVFHAQRREFTFMEDKNNESLGLYQKHGQFTLLKRKQLQQTQENVQQIQNNQPTIKVEQIQKNGVQNYSQMKKSVTPQRQDQEIRKLQQLDSWDVNDEIHKEQYFCNNCKKEPYSSYQSYNQHIRKYHQRSIPKENNQYNKTRTKQEMIKLRQRNQGGEETQISDQTPSINDTKIISNLKIVNWNVSSLKKNTLAIIKKTVHIFSACQKEVRDKQVENTVKYSYHYALQNKERSGGILVGVHKQFNSYNITNYYNLKITKHMKYQQQEQQTKQLIQLFIFIKNRNLKAINRTFKNQSQKSWSKLTINHSQLFVEILIIIKILYHFQMIQFQTKQHFQDKIQIDLYNQKLIIYQSIKKWKQKLQSSGTKNLIIAYKLKRQIGGLTLNEYIQIIKTITECQKLQNKYPDFKQFYQTYKQKISTKKILNKKRIRIQQIKEQQQHNSLSEQFSTYSHKINYLFSGFQKRQLQWKNNKKRWWVLQLFLNDNQELIVGPKVFSNCFIQLDKYSLLGKYEPMMIPTLQPLTQNQIQKLQKQIANDKAKKQDCLTHQMIKHCNWELLKDVWKPETFYFHIKQRSNLQFSINIDLTFLIMETAHQQQKIWYNVNQIQSKKSEILGLPINYKYRHLGITIDNKGKIQQHIKVLQQLLNYKMHKIRQIIYEMDFKQRLLMHIILMNLISHIVTTYHNLKIKHKIRQYSYQGRRLPEQTSNEFFDIFLEKQNFNNKVAPKKVYKRALDRGLEMQTNILEQSDQGISLTSKKELKSSRVYQKTQNICLNLDGVIAMSITNRRITFNHILEEHQVSPSKCSQTNYMNTKNRLEKELQILHKLYVKTRAN